ncbi:MAG: peptidase T [Rhodothermales bacterium]
MPSLPADAVPDLPSVARRFVRYVQIDTQSDPDAETTPSTEKQKDLSRLLADELCALGIDAAMDAFGYVYATLPSTLADASRMPTLGLVAHVDTSPDEPGTDVRPFVHTDYQGDVIAFPGDASVTLDPARQPALLDHLGHDLITSDGTTLLGSDDKAGVAVLMQLVEDLLDDDAPRPEVRLLFTVDEEIGRGVDKLDRERFGAGVAYTVDGGGVGGIYAETFNAAEATVTVEGVTVHPGYAHGVMANAVRILAEIVATLPADEAPETTEGRAGYVHPHTITHGETGHAAAKILLRDFETEGMERRKALVHRLADEAAARHPRARIGVEIRDSYQNMLRYIEASDPRTVTFAEAAARTLGIEPELRLVRGGTDGARLSELGIPTPNLFTGGHDFHSRFEWNTVQNLETSLAFVKTLVRHWGEHGGA